VRVSSGTHSGMSSLMHVEWSSGAHLKASPPSPSECWPRAQSQKFFGQFVGQTNSSLAAVELV
jgi:hypothetical protein